MGLSDSVPELLRTAEGHLVLSRFEEAEDASREVLRRTVYMPGTSVARAVRAGRFRASLFRFLEASLVRARDDAGSRGAWAGRGGGLPSRPGQHAVKRGSVTGAALLGRRARRDATEGEGGGEGGDALSRRRRDRETPIERVGIAAPRPRSARRRQFGASPFSRGSGFPPLPSCRPRRPHREPLAPRPALPRRAPLALTVRAALRPRPCRRV